jgi:GNAT superfamily N-acetyltransferase
MRVRPMTERDARAAAELAGQLGYPSTAEQIRRRLAGLSGDPESAVFVAESDDGRVVGWVHVVAHCFLEMDPYAELGGLVVDAAARRQGAGKALVSAAEEWAAGRGYATMRVRSNMKRAEAQPFYEGAGYVIVKSQNVYEKTLR